MARRDAPIALRRSGGGGRARSPSGNKIKLEKNRHIESEQANERSTTSILAKRVPAPRVGCEDMVLLLTRRTNSHELIQWGPQMEKTQQLPAYPKPGARDCPCFNKSPEFESKWEEL